jgi:transcriptional regulator with XRE-family HTH domain
MNASGSTDRGGARLKQLRERLGLTLRQVEALSKQLALKKKNQDFFISRGWLNNVENGAYTPGVCKLYSLGAIYHTHWSNIFAFFGLHLSDFGRDQAMFAPPKTQLAADANEPDDTIVVPLQSSEAVCLDRTNLLSKLVEIWGEIPIRLIQHLDLRNGVYGVVGISDFTMYPIIRPGSIVQIDQSQRKILSTKWETEHERPIFFIELRGEYICSWCEMNGGYLSAVPHPNSKCEVRRFSYPREAEIVGRVVGVTMRLADKG